MPIGKPSQRLSDCLIAERREVSAYAADFSSAIGHKKAPHVPYKGSPWPFASKVGALSAAFVFRLTAGQRPKRVKLPIAKE